MRAMITAGHRARMKAGDYKAAMRQDPTEIHAIQKRDEAARTLRERDEGAEELMRRGVK
jgi:hypothetical protein